MNKKILISLSVIGIVAAIAIGATSAYFSDTETSTGNTFTAGSIDLKIDNESYAIDYTIPDYPSPTGALVKSVNNSWDLDDLTGKVFFNFVDLKPGDIGEDTISIHVDNNDAWVCMSAEITTDDDMTCTEPELEDDATCEEPGTISDGELGGEIQFIFWADDGDNVLEEDEFANGVFEGTIRDFEITSPRIVADSTWNIFTGAPGPLTGGKTYYIGKAWCFGNLYVEPLVPGDLDPTTAGNVHCDGYDVDNSSQSDQVTGNITFYAEQARNNDSFTCIGY